MIYETKQDNGVLYEKKDFDDAEDADTELEDNKVVGFYDFNIPGENSYYRDYRILTV